MSLPFLHPHYSSPQQVLVCPRNEGFWGPELGKEMLRVHPLGPHQIDIMQGRQLKTKESS